MAADLLNVIAIEIVPTLAIIDVVALPIHVSYLKKPSAPPSPTLACQQDHAQPQTDAATPI